jgi:ribosomal peptide maturation radical SAM protein 1
MSNVLLVVMPFAGLEFPQLGVSLLKAQLRSRGIPVSIAYLNFPFAEAVGYQDYFNMSLSQVCDSDSLVGEWMFSRSVFSRDHSHDDAYLTGHLVAKYSCTPDLVNMVRRAANLVEPFLDHCLSIVDWDRFSIIGFTSTFEQTLPCLALAKRLKERFPKKTIIMGGANCADAMGIQLHKSFPFLDYVFTGEADFSFPELVNRLGNGDSRRDDIAGYVRREASQSVEVPATPVHEMEALAYPDFDDYFAAYRLSPLHYQFTPRLQMETARGCWWGAKHHCTFCGLNQNGMVFRGKSAERAMDELVHLVSRYGIADVAPTDNIISMDYFRTFLPELKKRKMGIKLFYETKANLTREQVKLMSEAGVTTITPGIESLSGHVLDLMRKGVSPLQNVQLLKWCREYGVHPYYHMLRGFPGERQEDYEEVYRNAENLGHLPPPINSFPLRIERFSPYFDSAADFGIRNLHAHPSYKHIYPFDDSALFNLAYFFDCDYDEQKKADEWSAPIKNLIERWQHFYAQSRLEVVLRTPQAMVVSDTRPNAVHPLYRFETRQAAVVDACDSARILPQISKELKKTLYGLMPDEAWIGEFVSYLKDCRLALEADGRYLSLILPRPAAA